MREVNMNRELEYYFYNSQLISGLKECGCKTVSDVMKTPYIILLKNNKVIGQWDKFIDVIVQFINIYQKS